MGYGIAGLLSLACIGQSLAAKGRSAVGDWQVTADDDRFGDGGKYIAMTIGDGASFFAVRCIRKEWSLAVIAGKQTAGDLFSVRLRVDKNDIVDEAGVAIDDLVVQIDPAKAVIRQILDGREIALRLKSSKGVTQDYVFGISKARAALARHVKECSL